MVYSIDSEINNNEIKMDKTKLIQDCTRIKLEIDTIIKEVITAYENPTKSKEIG